MKPTPEMIEAACSAFLKEYGDECASTSDYTKEIEAAITAALSAMPAMLVKGLEVVRHKKRGTTYEVIGVGKMQSENWRELIGEQQLVEGEEVGTAVDMREVTIYRSTEDGQIWVRPIEEFNDGRFEARILSAIEPAGVWMETAPSKDNMAWPIERQAASLAGMVADYIGGGPHHDLRNGLERIIEKRLLRFARSSALFLAPELKDMDR